MFSSLTAAVGAADKVVELMQQKPAIPAQGALQPADFAGTVELDSVAFSYPARPETSVLNGLSLKVNPGEVSASLIAFHSEDVSVLQAQCFLTSTCRSAVPAQQRLGQLHRWSCCQIIPGND